MANSRIATSSIVQGFPKSRSMLAGNTATTGLFDSIATVTVGSGGSAYIEFTSIPSTYSRLQIRGIYRNNNSGDDSVGVRFNSDTGTNYSQRGLYSGGASVGNFNTANSSDITIWSLSANASTFGISVMDIIDYSDTNKYKTLHSLTGYDQNGSGYILLQGGNWRSTSAITTIRITPRVGTFQQYTQVALYGIKGA